MRNRLHPDRGELYTRECVFEGNIERASERASSGTAESSEETVHRIDSSRSARAKEMPETPVSFVVGDPEPDPNHDTDPSEVQEIEDSFPSEGSDNGNLQMHINAVAGLVERRKRLR